MGKSARALQYFQANEIGCHIITVGDSILEKVGLIGKI